MGRERVNTCVGVETRKRSPRDGCRCGLCVCPAVIVLPGPARVAGVPKARPLLRLGRRGYFRSALTCGTGRGVCTASACPDRGSN